MNHLRRPFQLMVCLVFVIFFFEVIIMAILAYLPPFSVGIEMFIDAFALAVLVSPSVYFLSLRPLIQQTNERLRLAKELEETNRSLEGRVKERTSEFFRQSEELKAANEELKAYADLLRNQKSKMEVVTESITAANQELQNEIGSRRLAEEALQQSEVKFRTLYESSGDAVMLLDDKGFFDCNSATLSMFGCASIKEFCSKHPADLSPPFQPDGTGSMTLANKQIETAMKEGSNSFEWIHHRIDGEDFFADVLLNAMELDGRPVLQAVVRDISERKKTELAVRESEQSLNITLNSIGDAVIATDAACRILRMNPVAEQLTGWTFSEARGKALGDIFRIINEKTRETVASPAEKALQGGRIVGLANHTILIGRDGTECPIADSAAPITSAEGKVMGVVLVFRDVTDERKAENELNKAYQNETVLNELLHISFEDASLEDALAHALDVLFSASWLTILPKGAIFLVEDKPSVLVLKAQKNLLEPFKTMCAQVPFGRCLCGRAAASGKLVHAEHIDSRHENRCEGMAPHGHYCVPILADHCVLGVIDIYLVDGHIRDEKEVAFLEIVANSLAAIIKHKQAEEALHRSNEELLSMNERISSQQSQLVQSEKMASIGQLAAGVAHEINNPVGFVMSNIGTVAEYVAIIKKLIEEYDSLDTALKEGDTEKQTACRDRITQIREREDIAFVLEDIGQALSESSDGTKRVRDIVQNLKSFARLDVGERKEANINDGIEATLKIIWNELKYKCKIRKDLGSIPNIQCCPGELNQVFMNLLINAAHAIPEHGDITIRTRTTDTDIIVEISDTGSGIPPENIPKLFDPFFTTKEAGKGTGLGLSISHGIIQKHNGTIAVESEVGKGTTFTVRLPINDVKKQDTDLVTA